MRKCRITRHCFFDRGLDLIIQVLGICVSARALLCRRRVGRVNLSEAAWGMLGQRARAKWSPPRARMLNTGGSVNKIHGSSNQIRVLRTKIRVLFVFESLKNETPLVLSILGHVSSRIPPRESRGRARQRLKRRPPSWGDGLRLRVIMGVSKHIKMIQTVFV